MTATLTRLPDDWRDWPPEQKRALIARMQERVYQARRKAWNPYPWQVCPEPVGTHGTWLQLGGRGTGKTDGMARYVDEHVNGPACSKRAKGGHRVAIVAPTLGDAVEACVTGISGLQAHNPRIKLRGGHGGTKAVWPSGAEARLFGTHSPEDVERLRAGGNRCLVWYEEAAAMRHLGPALEHSAYGLRVGPNPHFVMSTTPKPRKEIRELLADPRTVVTRGKTSEATHLDPTVRADLYRKYLGTRRGRQELDGELLTDVEGALWFWSQLDNLRVLHYPTLSRIVVAIDPAASNTEDSDETGIIVAGLDNATGHGYCLDDLSGRYDPAEWGRVALDAADRWGAARIVAEKNNGGAMVGHVLTSVGGDGRYDLVNASEGKRARAEPVSALTEQGRIHHVGSFPELEEQLTSWVPAPNSDSPDRLDAYVWAFTALMINPKRGFVSSA